MSVFKASFLSLSANQFIKCADIRGAWLYSRKKRRKFANAQDERTSKAWATHSSVFSSRVKLAIVVFKSIVASIINVSLQKMQYKKYKEHTHGTLGKNIIENPVGSKFKKILPS